jgi:F420-dependent oxidoreductase-like protein
MRFGIQTPQFGWHAADLLDLWSTLDTRSAFSSLWTMDHLLPPLRGAVIDAPCFEAWALLGAAARATCRIRLGCLVSANTFRHPALLAKMALTVDHLSGGRLTVGLGAGWFEEEHRVFGIPLPGVRERLDRLEEAAHLLRIAFASTKPVRFAGDHYRLEDAPFTPRSLQSAGLPLLIGGDGERRTLAIVARHADVANFQGPLSVVRRKLRVLREHCNAVGRDFAEIQKTVHVPVELVEEASALRAARDFVASHLSITATQAREEIPVGPPAHVREVLGAYREMGITEVILPQVGPIGPRRLDDLNREILQPMSGAAT